MAHARLCEQIAQGCRNEATAEELKQMAQKCTHTAAQMTLGRDTAAHTKH
jgi:hypothetical protein